jgi:hypothetical protein
MNLSHESFKEPADDFSHSPLAFGSLLPVNLQDDGFAGSTV